MKGGRAGLVKILGLSVAEGAVRPPVPPQAPLSLSLAEFLAQEFAPLRWVVPGLIPAGGLVLLAGPQKTGKTPLGMDLGAAVAAGQPVGRSVLAGPTCDQTPCKSSGAQGQASRVPARELAHDPGIVFLSPAT